MRCECLAAIPSHSMGEGWGEGESPLPHGDIHRELEPVQLFRDGLKRRLANRVLRSETQQRAPLVGDDAVFQRASV